METRILTLFTRTPLHVGAGNSVGAVDAPVMRERHTRIPIVPGSSLKGVLRDLWAKADPDTAWLFGNEQNAGKDQFRAGALLIGEARVLAFPVRSAKGCFAWVTCPLALSRFRRDSGQEVAVAEPVASDQCLAAKALTLDGKVVLEEYCLACTGETTVWKHLTNAVADAVWTDLGNRFVVLSDELFSYFAEHACEVVTRVRIDDEAGTVAEGALFNQEQVPSETLFYAVIAAQDEKGKGLATRRSPGAALAALDQRLAAADVAGLLQVGGDETTGLGWCSVKLLGKEA